MTRSQIELAGVTYVVDASAARPLLDINPEHWIESNTPDDRVRLQPRKADTEAWPQLRTDQRYSVAALNWLFVRRVLPPFNHVPIPTDGNPYNVTVENTEWLSRADLARQTLQPQVDPDGGITELPSGRFRARAYVNGALRGVGTFDTREEARDARDFALAHPESMPSDKPKSRKPKETTVPASKHKATERQLLQLRTENAELKAKIDAMQRQLDLYAPAF